MLTLPCVDQASSSSNSGRLSVATRERDVYGGTPFVLVFALILSQIDDLHRSVEHNKSSRMTTLIALNLNLNPNLSLSTASRHTLDLRTNDA